MSSSVQNTDLEMGSPNRKITIPYVETVNKAPCRYECRYDGHCFIHTHACMDLILIHPRPTSSLVGSPRRDSCPPDTDERLMNGSANSYPTQRKPHLPSRLNRSSPPQAVRPRRNTVSLCITNPGPPLTIKPWRQGLTCMVPLNHILSYVIISRLSRPQSILLDARRAKHRVYCSLDKTCTGDCFKDLLLELGRGLGV